MKRLVILALCVPVIAAVQPSMSALAAPKPSDVSTVAVYGDAPYGTSPTDTAEFEATPAFIDDVNADPDVSLVVHVGDIHSGKQYCTEPYDQSIFDLWTGYQDPLVYTPGDNEWTDCHKTAEGGNVFVNGQPVDYANGDPIANLALIRSIFFADPGTTLGSAPRQVLSQANVFDPSFPSDAQFVENVIWEQSDVVFVTIDLPGGSNNDQDVWYGAATETTAQAQERINRTGADLRWLDTAFGLAHSEHAKGVVIVAQADMWDPEKGAAHQSGYEPIVQSLAAHTHAFDRPVLMFNGDSHVYRSDNPLSRNASCAWELSTPCTSVAYIHPGYNVPNFHRVVVHGSTFPLEWLKLTVDPSANVKNGATAFGPFSWVRQPQS
jgi:hypothetical protein